MFGNHFIYVPTSGSRLNAVSSVSSERARPVSGRALFLFLPQIRYYEYMIPTSGRSNHLKKPSKRPASKSVRATAGKRRVGSRSDTHQSMAVKSRVSSKRFATDRERIASPGKGAVMSSMHPYIRTMFLSLAVGTVGVFASMAYYIHIARATEPYLFQRTSGRASAEMAMNSVDGSLVGLIQGLEEQRTDAGGMMPILPREYLRIRTESLELDTDLLNRIAYCESHWRMVQNKKSTAFGYFQILDGTELLTPQYQKGLRKTDPYVNIDMAIWLYQRYGTAPWVESQSCWSVR